MLRNRKHLVPAAAALALAVSATGLMAGSETSKSGDVRCEISATKRGGMTTLEGLVHAEKAVSGSYTFHVESSSGGGSSNIRQGGDFSARRGTSATVGQVTLGGSGSVFDATLEVDTPDGKLKCSKRTGAL